MSAQTQKRGTFIVLEGLDRSGKSTQAAILLERMQAAGIPAKFMKFPDRTTPIGKMIDAYLRSETELDDHAVHLLFSANRWELASIIESTLRAGTTIICDRYAFSGIAFSYSKLAPPPPSTTSSSTTAHVGSLLSYEWCRGPDIGLPAPDLTLFLDVPPSAVRARGGFGEERYEQPDVQQRVKEAFERIGEEMGEGILREGRWVVVEAERPKEDVAKTVWEWVGPLAAGTDRPLTRLWDEKENKERNEQLYI